MELFVQVFLFLYLICICIIFLDPRPFIFPELLPFMVERNYGFSMEHDLQNFSDSYKCC